MGLLGENAMNQAKREEGEGESDAANTMMGFDIAPTFSPSPSRRK